MNSSVETVPDPECLEAFLAFAEHLNFTRAARALHRSQPAVHAQVRRLAELLGVTLYRRSGRGLELTEEGRRTAAFARELTERSRTFVASLRAEPLPQRVVLCAGEGAYLYLLGPALKSFARRHAKEYPLRLLSRDAVATIEAVQAGEAHLGVAVLGALPLPDDLTSHSLLRVPQVLVVPRTHPLAKKKSLELEALAHASLVLPPQGRQHRDTIETLLRAAEIPFSIAIEAQGWELLMHFASLGLGLSIVNGCCRLPSNCVGIPLRELPPTEYLLLQRRDLHLHGPTLELRQTLLAQCSPRA